MSGIGAFFEQARTGFSRTFWIANIIELFERFAYYGSKAILAVYIAEQVGLGPGKAGFLVGSLFNTLLYFLPPLAGTIVDRYGFKKSLLACFSIFSVGYFLIGLGGLPQGKPLVDALGGATYMIVALVITAIGGSLIKPSIVGTVARTTTPETKSLGYSIYYTLVNLGGAIGPLLAMQVRENLGIAYVLVMSSLVSLGLIAGTAIFFREPPRPADAPPPKSMAKVLADMFMVFRDLKFMTFLVIFSGFWIMFWEIFYALPFYVRDVLHFEKFEIIETVDAWTIILITIPITALAKRMKPLAAMTLGFAHRFGLLVPDGADPDPHRDDRGDRDLRDRRRPPGAALLRVRRRSRAEGAGRHLHGLRLPAGGDRHLRLRRHRRPARRTLRRRAPGRHLHPRPGVRPRRADVVLGRRDRHRFDPRHARLRPAGREAPLRREGWPQ